MKYHRINPSFKVLCFIFLSSFITNLYAIDTDNDGINDDVDNCILLANADQRDTDNDGYGNRCDGDLHPNGIIDWDDINRTYWYFGSLGDDYYNPEADINGDNIVDGTDADLIHHLMSTQGKPGPSAHHISANAPETGTSPAPEPTPEAETNNDTTDTDGDGVFDVADNCTLIVNPDQRDSNNNGFGNRCDGDLYPNGIIDWEDINRTYWYFGNLGDDHYNPDADINGDNRVDGYDAELIKEIMNTTGLLGPAGSIVGTVYEPEPTPTPTPIPTPEPTPTPEPQPQPQPTPTPDTSNDTTDTDGDGVYDVSDNCTLVANPDQRDTNNNGFGNRCDGDLHPNGIIDWEDINRTYWYFGSLGDEYFNPDADINGDNIVDGTDADLIHHMMTTRGQPGPAGMLSEADIPTDPGSPNDNDTPETPVPDEPQTPDPEDNQSPSVPTELSTSFISYDRVNLVWTAASDNIRVSGYKVFRDGVEIATVSQNHFLDSDLNSLTDYQYQILAFDAASNESALSAVLTITTTDNTPAEAFSFIVIGDFNGGGCARHDRVNRVVQMIANNESNAAFYMSTGDIIDGYWDNNGKTSCFATDPATISAAAACGDGIPNGNVSDILSPLKNRPPVAGLSASFYMALGNHDDSWGNWYPDPCGEGICEFFAPQSPLAFLNNDRFNPETICGLEQNQSDYPTHFYYSFNYQSSYFIVLRVSADTYDLLSCNQHPGFDNCVDYCTSEQSKQNPALRADYCYNVHQYDWLENELQKARDQNFENIFVFAHTPVLGSGEGHKPVANANAIRNLFDQYGVDMYMNGHNHGYERTYAVRANQRDPNGTVYVTTGVSGALVDGVETDEFTAASYHQWTHWGDSSNGTSFEEKMATYLKVVVDGDKISGEVYSLGIPGAPVDSFSLQESVDSSLSISNVGVTNISANAATIGWNSNKNANAIVDYGLSSDNLDKTQVNLMLPEGTYTDHSLTISELQPNTTYYYQVKNTTNDETISSTILSFTTQAVIDNSLVPEMVGCKLFPGDNMWNTPIDTLPLHPLSDNYINSVGAGTAMHPDFGTVWNGINIGISYDIIPDDQAMVDVTFDYWDETDPLNIDSTIKAYPIPVNPTIEGGTDNHVLLLQENTCILYELFAVQRDDNNQWTAGSGAIWHLDQNEVRPRGVTSADAAGLAILPGLIRYEEVYGDPQQGIQAGINHALRVTMNSIQSGYIRPASHSDGQASHDPNYPPMGLRLRLKADYEISGFDPAIQVILRAMKKYGIVIADTGGDMFISGTHDMRWDTDVLRQLQQITIADFEAVYTGDVIDYP